MKKLLLLSFFFFFSGCSSSSETIKEYSTPKPVSSIQSSLPTSKNITVKYRDINPVDIGSSRFVGFSPQDKTVKNAYFDASNKYMIISLKGVYYHYCRFSQSDWKVFIDASSVDDFYKTHIKGNFDCRNGGVPTEY